MYLESGIGSEAGAYSHNLGIHQWISTHPPTDKRSSSITSAAVRADSPVPEFTSHENAAHNPLHGPSLTYLQHLPGGMFPSNEDKSLLALYHGMRMPSADIEQEIFLQSFMRNRPFPRQNHYLTHLSPLQPWPPILPQPQASLPLMRGSTPLSPPSRQTLGPDILPYSRSHSHLRPAPVLTSQQTVKLPSSPTYEKYTAKPVATENADPCLERQRLNALVIASGLADEDELRANGAANNSSPSRVHLETNWSAPIEVKSSRDDATGNHVSSVVSQKQFVIDPYPSRTSTYLDEFDEDASYYVKETDSLFLPYCHPLKDVSPVSKWSLSSSVEIDLVSKRSSPQRSLKSKAVKFWSFISRFSFSSNRSSSDKHCAHLKFLNLSK